MPCDANADNRFGCIAGKKTMDSDEISLPYFAYGSNLNPEQMAARCPGHRVIGRARLLEHAIRFRGEGHDWEGAVASVEPEPGSTVFGALFALTPGHYAALDDYEGCDEGLYARVERVVIDETGRPVRALTYVMRADPPGLPSRRYVDAIVRGMRHHDLPADAIAAMAATPVTGEATPRA
jgi:gamma-glutamylcyclotransferase (GGCT)/AIG2-like uncharacterized protein YtfP